VLASSKSCYDIGTLLHGYQLCAASEGKSPNSLAIVAVLDIRHKAGPVLYLVGAYALFTSGFGLD
jgi:hypothetical protein